MSTAKVSQTASQNPSPALDLVRASYNQLAGDLNYFAMNRGGTVAPGCTTGAGTGIKAATANATTYVAGGKPTALGASGNYWDLTTAQQGSNNLVGPAAIKYRLMADSGQNAHVQSSSVDPTGNANNCVFPAQPGNNNTVLGMLTVVVSTGNNFTPGTTGLGGTGVTNTFQDGSDGSELIAPIAVTP